MNRVRILTLVMLVASAQQVNAGGGACSECGCKDRHLTCRLVCEEKEVSRWDCKLENFCLPPPSHRCGKDCQCDASQKTDISHWQPMSCGDVRTRKVLVKGEAKETVPSYRWVIEEVCAKCGSSDCEQKDGATSKYGHEPIGAHSSGHRARHSSRGEE